MKKFIVIFLCIIVLLITQTDIANAGCKCRKKRIIKKTVTVHKATKKYNSNLDRYLDLSRQGDKQGTYAAANAYYTGKETPISYAYAIPFFSKIPDYYDSSFKIATMFRSGGYGIHKSPNDAKKWFAYYYKINLQEGHKAAYQIGEMYERGEINGTPDKEAAIIWYKKAAEKNNARAEMKLEQLEDKSLFSWLYKLFD